MLVESAQNEECTHRGDDSSVRWHDERAVRILVVVQEVAYASQILGPFQEPRECTCHKAEIARHLVREVDDAARLIGFLVPRI